MKIETATESEGECHWLVDVERYDRDPRLSQAEKRELAYLATHHVGASAGPWRERSKIGLHRLIKPLHDTLNAMHLRTNQKCYTIRALMLEMHRRGRSYWSWNDTEWLERILGVLTKWGYKPSIQGKIHTALAYTLLKNRSPRLEDISFGFLQTLNQKVQTKYSLSQLYPLSRALADLKIIQTPLPLRRQSLPLLERSTPREWL